MIGRRRFLTIMAGGIYAAGVGQAAEWRGRVLGGDARIVIRGGDAPAEVIVAIRGEIDRIERVFSLYRESELTRLNRDGRGRASGEMVGALDLARQVHDATGGVFDPGVQLLWSRLARPGPEISDTRLLPFAGLRQSGRDLALARGQALTFNGLAQGVITDRISGLLERFGLRDVLVDMGEARAVRGDFRLELADPAAGILGRITLRAGRAVATSSPGAMLFPGGESHILGPQGQPPQWSTVSVEAGSAALADAASTGFVLMDRRAIAEAAKRLGLGPVRLVDFDGNLSLT